MSSVKEFLTYLDEITEPLSLDDEEKKDLKEEWYQHLVDLMNTYISKGASKDEAIKLSLNQFGSAELLKSKINSKFSSPRKIHLLKELLIWSICLIAASIGPGILINAHYSISFVTAPLFFLSLCYIVFHLVVNRFWNTMVRFMGLTIFYSYFVYIVFIGTSIYHNIERLLSLGLWGDGLFTPLVIHLFWLIIVFYKLVTPKFKASYISDILRVSFEYWFMIFFALIVVRFEILTSSSEAKVIMLNIFLLYSFLKQVINPKFFITSKNKLSYWLKG